MTRPRRLAAAALAAAAFVAIALAGCTAIPTSGAVHAGVQNGGGDQSEGQVRAPAQRPVAGEPPDQIVDGFRQASGDAADLSIARAYLVDANWNPSGVRVIAEPVAPTYSPSGDHASVRFVDKWIGTIAPDGTYQPKGDGTSLDYTYELTKVKGEWRLLNPPGYSIATVNGVDDFYDASYLYFLSPRHQMLVPARVFLPSVKDPATELINQLLQGPPRWLADAGVATAVPDGTSLVDAVSEDPVTHVVTVNLSAEFAGLAAADRDAACAQIIYTLQHFGGGDFRIEAAGQLVPAGVQTMKSLSAYDPDALKAGDFYYSGPEGRTYGANGVPVQGDAGAGVVRLETPVVAPRLADTPGNALIAGLEQGTSSQTLYVGPLSAPKSVMGAASFTTPSWDAFGNVWTVKQASATSPQQVMVSAVTQSGTTKFMTVANPELAQSDLIESLKVSRDGTRVAVVTHSTSTGTQVRIGHVIKTADGAALGGFYPVATSLVPLPDGVTWASSTTLDVLATAPGANTPTVWSVDVDGWQQPAQITPLPVGSGVVALTAAPNQSLVVETGAGQIEAYRDDAWQIIGPGHNPSYPG